MADNVDQAEPDESFPQSLVARIECLRRTLDDVDPAPLSEWLDGFRGELDPESEVLWWERLTECYREYSDTEDLSTKQRQIAFRVFSRMARGSPSDAADLAELPEDAPAQIQMLLRTFYDRAGEPDRLLTEGARARIRAAKLNAEFSLQEDLSKCLPDILANTESLQKHDPSELIPLFEVYAERLFDAYAREFLSHFATVAEYVSYLRWNVTAFVSRLIASSNSHFRHSTGDWTTLLSIANESGSPADRFTSDISMTACAWELNLHESFRKYMLKAGAVRRPDSDEHPEAPVPFNVVFDLKYRCYLLLWPNWSKFCDRFRAHLSNRVTFWHAKAEERLAVELAERKAKGKADENPRPPAGTAPIAEARVIPVGLPEDRLAQFMKEHPGTNYADIKYSAQVHTTEFQHWRNCRLKPASVMSKRIEDVISGARKLMKKPSKKRPD